MKLAIMQPYFFPYLGYFQLILASDKFVFYDDVNYIKGGWINRNRILLDGEAKFFTVPLRGASSFVPINRVGINEDNSRWRGKMLDTFRMAYRSAPYRDTGVGLLEEVLALECESIADLALASVKTVLEYLHLDRDLVRSSRIYNNQQLRGQDRVFDICKQENADVYINAIGGAKLYQADKFAVQGCDLKFLRSQLPEYAQGVKHFVPGLSILDAIMYCSPEEIRNMLPRYDLLPGVLNTAARDIGVEPN
jgi:hypothetical protein